MKKTLIVGVLLLAVFLMVLVSFSYPSNADATILADKNKVDLGERMGRGFGARELPLKELLADLTGLTIDEIRAQCLEGKSLAEIAATNGVKLDQLIDTIIDKRIAIMQERVTDGYLSQEIVDARINKIKADLEIFLQRKDSCFDGKFAKDDVGARGFCGGMGSGKGKGGHGHGNREMW